MAFSALEHYTTVLPTPQNALDVFRGEWLCKLPPPFDGLTAGTIPTFDDPRMHWAVAEIGGVVGRTVLELGPLEGGHSYLLERAGARSVLAIEANVHAYLKCLVVKEILGLERCRFLFGDFVRYLESGARRFDVCVASGVLYHMADPVALLGLLARATDRLCLWTHYYDPAVIERQANLRDVFVASASRVTEGFAHTVFRLNYGGALGVRGFCGGNAAYSHWMTRQDILDCLAHFGFRDVRVGVEDPNHPHGPCFTVAATRDGQ
jgi:uncharacterized protein DUF1698